MLVVVPAVAGSESGHVAALVAPIIVVLLVFVAFRNIVVDIVAGSVAWIDLD